MSESSDSLAKNELEAAIREQLDRGRASGRARRVAEFIFEHGSITTTDLEELGYSHAPRAVRDLKDAGVELKTEMEGYTNSQGRVSRRARYRFAGIDAARSSRRAPSKAFQDMIRLSGRCAVCGTTTGKMQADHRVPFDVGGETFPHVEDEWQLLCASCNREKSWACEHCANRKAGVIDVCESCMWASPDNYTHVAMNNVRQLTAVIEDEELIRLVDFHQPNIENIVIEFLRNQDHIGD